MTRMSSNSIKKKAKKHLHPEQSSANITADDDNGLETEATRSNDSQKKSLRVLNLKQFENCKKEQFKLDDSGDGRAGSDGKKIKPFICSNLTNSNPIKRKLLQNIDKSNKEKTKKRKLTKKSRKLNNHNDDNEEEEEEDDEDEWEAVEEEEINEVEFLLNKSFSSSCAISLSEPNSQSSAHGVEVFVKSKQKKKFSAEEQYANEVRCAINRSKTITQLKCHQVHILCLLAHGRYMNSICNDYELMCFALSMAPTAYINKELDGLWIGETLHQFTKWFNMKFHISEDGWRGEGRKRKRCSRADDDGDFDPRDNSHNLKKMLKRQLVSCRVINYFYHNMLFVIMMRSLGLRVRLVHSFHPISSQPTDLIKKPSSTSPQKMKLTPKNKDIEKRNDDAVILNSDDVDDGANVGADCADDGSVEFDWWSEVYLEREQKWIYVSSYRCKVGGLSDVKMHARKPLQFIIAHDCKGYMKDLTSKYDSDWLKVTCKKRKLISDWWLVLMNAYKDTSSVDQSNEDLSIEESLSKQALPQSWSAYKNHPLYAMKRHLLKYECIYPESSVTLGFVRGEAVYSRDCVHTLRSRKKWLIEGRVVKDNVSPCKIIKHKKRLKNKVVMEEDLELFGRWQTEQFIPMPAIDGKVPKNEFGNVELFQPWMLPGGTVYIEERMDGLNRLANKLQIDIAPAMMGWNFIGNVSAPILKGWVVCEEHKDILLSAWQDEQKRIRLEEKKKNEERIMNNWKILIKGVLIRERLRKDFNITVLS